MKYTQNNPLKVIELFSGIGSQRSALEKAGNSIVVDVMEYIFKNLFKG